MKTTKSPEIKQIDKDISKLRGKLNLQRHRYTSLEIESFEINIRVHSAKRKKNPRQHKQQNRVED